MNTEQFNRVAVLKGGPSAEREISLRSGSAAARGLREAGYDVVEVDVTGRAVDLPDKIEAAFIALHGEFGEDGQVQTLLRRRGIPYTGSGPEASAAAFDKKLTKKSFAAGEVPTPEYEIVRPGQRISLSPPVVIKPACQGSTIGVHRVFKAEEAGPALENALSYGGEALVEEYIPGRELTVGVVGKTPLPVVEIIAPEGWYDYEAKYTKGRTRYVVPAELSEEISSACREAGLRAFEILGCRGFARTDIRLCEDGRPYVLEVNSIPGFTETSLLPKAAAQAGLSFPELCDRIMRQAEV
ncbi:MAG: D-alanine--D-alanine ligase [Kiritimatiellia bacterium]